MDVNEQQLLQRIKTEYLRILGDKLAGIYVHGSLAFGCYRREVSDIDFLVTLNAPLLQTEKEQMISALLALDEQAPPKGFEMSAVLCSVCAPFRYPTPYELHYSNAYRQRYTDDLAGTCRDLNGCDADLAAHITVTRQVGIALYGPPPCEMFAPVPKECYLDAIWQDICDAQEGIRRDPVYYVLNLCRVLAYVQDGAVLSKEQGGEWGMGHLKEDQNLIAAALECYRGQPPKHTMDGLEKYAQKVTGLIRQNSVFLSACNKNIDRQP